jgi:anthranilate phosphoribosyltransferase
MNGDIVDFKAILAIVADGRALTEREAEAAFDTIMSGDATPAQMGAFLMALRMRGETVDEITAAARVMRAKARPIMAPPGAIDIVGTGGDRSGTLNISTASALVAAGCGVPVAKHGNRALSSRSGAADVLAALGVDIDADMRLIEKSIAEAHIGFMMAPRHHSATRHVAGPRVELATRTIFNLLGPLSNPAMVSRLLVGVFAREWVEPLAHVLGKLGADRAWVVHGEAGLDELTTTGNNYIAELKDGNVTQFEISPEDAGFERAALDAIKGGDAEYNADALTGLLDGAPGAYRDTVLMTTGGALVVAGQADDLAAGIALAARSIESGRAREALARMVEISHEEIIQRPGGDLRAQARARRRAQDPPPAQRGVGASRPCPAATRLPQDVAPGIGIGRLRPDRRDQTRLTQRRSDPARLRSGHPGPRL